MAGDASAANLIVRIIDCRIRLLGLADRRKAEGDDGSPLLWLSPTLKATGEGQPLPRQLPLAEPTACATQTMISKFVLR